MSKISGNGADLLGSRISRNELWLARLQREQTELRTQFANAVKTCDTTEMHRLGIAYGKKAEMIAKVELIVLEAETIRSRPVHWT